MLNIFWRVIKDKKISIISYCLASMLFLWMYVAIYPSIAAFYEKMRGYLESFPQGVMKAFGIEVQAMGTFEGFLSAEQFGFVWPFMLIALLITLAGTGIAGEIEKGTMELLLSQPVSRLKIFFSKYLTALFVLLIFILASVVLVFPLARIYDISYHSEKFFKLGILGFIFGLAIFGLATLFSVIFSESGKAIFLPAGILIVMYVINIVSRLKESLDNLKYFSFFYYFNPTNALVHNKIDNLAWPVFLGSFVLTTILAALWFKKRDIAI